MGEAGSGVVIAVGDPVVPSFRAAERLAAGGGPSLTVVNARWVKPLDVELIESLVRDGTRVITVEENARAGGFGSAVSEALETMGVTARLKRLGIPDRFVPHATQTEQRREIGLDEEGLLREFEAFFAGETVPVPSLEETAGG